MSGQSKPDWYRQLRDTPWSEPKLSHEQEQQILNNARQKITVKSSVFRRVLLSAVVLAMMISLYTYSAADPLQLRQRISAYQSWSVHHAAWSGDQKNFRGYAGR